MASIIILGVKVPFTRGGQDVLVNSLKRELVQRGHEVDIIEVPFNATQKESLITQARIWRSLELQSIGGRPCDLVIATKFPSYYVSHPRKSLWLVHQERSIYELWGGRFSDFSDDPREVVVRDMLIAGDTKAIGECAYRSGISQNVVDRLRLFNNLDASVLYPPLPLAGRYYSAEPEPYILSVGRLCSIKRVDLMVKALPMIPRHVRLKVVGAPDEAGVLEYLENEAQKHHIADRIDFLGRVSDEALLDLYARALAVYYAPFDEDYGYVTLEAMASGRPVITAWDSGGTLEFVEQEVSGIITDPTAQGIADACCRLEQDRDLCRRLGSGGLERIHTSGVVASGWQTVIEGLLSPLAPHKVRP